MIPEEEQQVISYLLDAGPEGSRLKIENRLLADIQWVASVREIEEELVRDYCKRELETAVEMLFEHRMRWDTHLQKKVALSKAILAESMDMKAAPKVSIFGILRAHASLVAASGVAAVLSAGVAWTLMDNASLRSRLADAARDRTALVQENRRLGGSGNRAEDLSARLPAAITLVPGLTQGESRPQRIEIAPGIREVTLHLVITRPVEADRFRVVLQNADIDVVLESTAAASDIRRYLPVRVDSAKFAQGDYLLKLQTRKTSGGYEDWESLFFWCNSQVSTV